MKDSELWKIEIAIVAIATDHIDILNKFLFVKASGR